MGFIFTFIPTVYIVYRYMKECRVSKEQWPASYHLILPCTEILLCRLILIPRLIIGTIQRTCTLYDYKLESYSIYKVLTYLKWQKLPYLLLWQPMWTSFMLSVHQFQHLHTELLTPRYTNTFHVYQIFQLPVYMNKVKKLTPNGRSLRHFLQWLQLNFRWKIFPLSFLMLVTAGHTLTLVHTCIKSLFGIYITTRTC